MTLGELRRQTASFCDRDDTVEVVVKLDGGLLGLENYMYHQGSIILTVVKLKPERPKLEVIK